MHREVVTANIVVFTASFCTLVIEIVAGRIMAPYVGVSLYTWTSIIGVVLAGISLGAYLGGKLADRFPRYGTLGWLLLFSGIAALAIAPLTDVIGSGGRLEKFAQDYDLTITLMSRIVVITTAVFLPPALFLGMISPVVVKLAVNNLAQTGNIVGKIYAFSTLGSTLGTFATGFFLIDWMGTRAILLTVALILIFAAPLSAGVFRGRGALLLLYLLFVAVVAGALGLYYSSLIEMYDKQFREQLADYSFVDESNYYTIKVREAERADGKGTVQILLLDHLIHSHSDLNDPSYLEYDYLKYYEEVVRWQARKRDGFNALFIGGGGYTFPRFLEWKYPKAEINVAEIDPKVTWVAQQFLGVPLDTRIRTFNADARWHIMQSKATGKYDFIIGDAFNDLSVPYHLTTKEFAQHVKRLMKPDGILMANIIDNFQTGTFLPSYIRTLEEVFGRGNVHLLLNNLSYLRIKQSTFIVVASPTWLDLRDFVDAVEGDLAVYLAPRVGRLYQSWLAEAAIVPMHGGWGPLISIFRLPRQDYIHLLYGEQMEATVMPARDLQDYLDRLGSKVIILTDDHVPVDNMLAPLFEERFTYRRR